MNRYDRVAMKINEIQRELAHSETEHAYAKDVILIASDIVNIVRDTDNEELAKLIREFEHFKKRLYRDELE